MLRDAYGQLCAYFEQLDADFCPPGTLEALSRYAPSEAAEIGPFLAALIPALRADTSLDDEQFLRLFLSSAKDFNQNPALADARFNRNGGYVIRLFLANWVAQVNRSTFTRDDSFENTGVKVIHNIFDPIEVDTILRAFDNMPNSSRLLPENIFWEVFRAKEAFAKTFINKTFALVAPFIGRTDADAKKLFLSRMFLQRHLNRVDDGDVNKVYHYDTFFPAIKFWYFPEDVKLSDGPLNVLTRSTNLSHRFLHWVHQQSINIAENKIEPWRTVGHAEGSLRTSIEEACAVEPATKEKLLTVPGNTLVIANVLNFHRRGEVAADCIRKAVHGSVRVNNPFYLR